MAHKVVPLAISLIYLRMLFPSLTPLQPRWPLWCFSCKPGAFPPVQCLSICYSVCLDFFFFSFRFFFFFWSMLPPFRYFLKCYLLRDYPWASQVALAVKNPPANAGNGKRHWLDPWVGKIPWRRKMATHSSILAWKIPWTEEPGRLHSMGSQRFGRTEAI